MTRVTGGGLLFVLLIYLLHISQYAKGFPQNGEQAKYHCKVTQVVHVFIKCTVAMGQVAELFLLPSRGVGRPVVVVCSALRLIGNH